MQVSQYSGGQLSAQDLGKSRQDLFAKADTNGDGGLDIDEFKALRQSLPGGNAAPVSDEKLAERFQKLDTDQDGKISEQEMTAARPQHRHHPALNLLAQAQQSDASTDAQQDPNASTAAAGVDQNNAAALIKQLQSAYSSLVASAHGASSTSIAV